MSEENQPLYNALSIAHSIYRDGLRQLDNPGSAYLQGFGCGPNLAEVHGLGFVPNSWDTIASAFTHDNAGCRCLDVGVEAGLIRKTPSGKYYDYLRGRITVPFYDEKDRVVGFAGYSVDLLWKPFILCTPETAVLHKLKAYCNLPPFFPPWSSTSSAESLLELSDELRRILGEDELEIVSWRNNKGRVFDA